MKDKFIYNCYLDGCLTPNLYRCTQHPSFRPFNNITGKADLLEKNSGCLKRPPV
jgi:hypothetical protein